jgi:hypothetical protein
MVKIVMHLFGGLCKNTHYLLCHENIILKKEEYSSFF